MASLNRVTLIGNLGADPEVRYTQNREAIATIRIATTETYKDKSSGEKKEITEWHRVVFFGRTAEVVGEYLKKGSPVYVEGRIQTRKWQDKEGQDRYVVEILASEMKMLGTRPADDDAPDAAPAKDDKAGCADHPLFNRMAGFYIHHCTEKAFDAFKFRSMYIDAERRKAELMAKNEADGPVFKMKNDPRVTGIGMTMLPSLYRHGGIFGLPRTYGVTLGFNY